ncbi:unnamed protein product [Leptidea sinapis]|uniref:Uncharacterized protein n=1 Tax=Leptidea sinapis TaxID=189913 RepID=A0A5E4QDY8_9NEOP|nr:unnamed protein product [Leptidea sinapis]
MDAPSKPVALQPQRNVRYHRSSTTFQITATKPPSDLTIRQPHSRILHSQRRRYTVDGPTQLNIPVTGTPRKRNITLTAEFLPGKYNDIADQLSRGRQEAEWHLLGPALKEHIFKTNSLQKPRAEKPPIWDPSDLVAWLQSNSPANDTPAICIFEASRRLACFLLLASGRRVHDLTLLKISPSHFTDAGDHVILLPAFGSKTDTASYRQSGWKLMEHSNHNIDPVFWLKKVVELRAQTRTTECNSALFVNIRGPRQAASRTVLGNWVRTVLRDAGITATPGSLRSAVTSLNWYNNYPIEDILSCFKQVTGITESHINLAANFEPV